MLRNRFPISVLILLAILFVSIIFLMQSFLLIDTNVSSSSGRTMMIRTMIGGADELQLEVDDLKQMRRSFLSELKQIEQKRRNLLVAVKNLQNQMETYAQEVQSLKQKHQDLRLRVAANLHKQAELDDQLAEKKNRLLIEFHQSFSNLTIKLTEISSSTEADDHQLCSIEKCFDYGRCRLDEKLKLFLFDDDDDQRSSRSISNLVDSLSSFEFVDRIDQSCLVLVILRNENIEAAEKQRLIELLSSQQQQHLNLIFIDFNRNQSSQRFSTMQSIRDYLGVGNQIESSTLLDRAQVASFNRFYQTTTNAYGHHHFSLLNYSSSDENKYDLIDRRHRSHLLAMIADQISDSSFSLIKPAEHKWSVHDTLILIESLKHSTIPVILNVDHRLPLDDLIVWDEVVIRFPSNTNNNLLLYLLSDVQHQDLLDRRIKARNLFESFFRSIRVQFATLIASLQAKFHLTPAAIPDYQTTTRRLLLQQQQDQEKEEIMINKNNNNEDNEGTTTSEEFVGETNPTPQASGSFRRNFTQSNHAKWNRMYFPFLNFKSTPFDPMIVSRRPPSQHEAFKQYLTHTDNLIGGGDGKFFNYHLSGQNEDEQFTIVVMTYKREEILLKQLASYVKLPYLNKIVVVWNDLDNWPPPAIAAKSELFSHNKIQVVRSEANSLNNRFLPYDLIETDCVLSLDDDIFLGADEIAFGFRVWRENRDRLVGFPARYHAFNLTSGSFVYQSHLTCEYSMILTGAAFYHRYYNYLYTYQMSQRIRTHVDAAMNCEDIAFNMLVSHATRKPPLKVTSKWNFYCNECSSTNNTNNSTNEQSQQQTNALPLSLQSGHYERRSNCIEKFASIYGYNPLIYTQYRADSVLYRTRIPIEKQKCFRIV